MKIKEIKKVHINMDLDYKEVAIELLENNGRLSNESIAYYVREKLETFLENFYTENDVYLDEASTVKIFKGGCLRPIELDFILRSPLFIFKSNLIRN